jgi:hypothetical protein
MRPRRYGYHSLGALLYLRSGHGTELAVEMDR